MGYSSSFGNGKENLRIEKLLCHNTVNLFVLSGPLVIFIGFTKHGVTENHSTLVKEVACNLPGNC